MIQFPSVPHREAQDIICQLVDWGVADGNPWVCQFAAKHGEDLGDCLRVWRRVDTSTYAEVKVHFSNQKETLRKVLTLHWQYETLSRRKLL